MNYSLRSIILRIAFSSFLLHAMCTTLLALGPAEVVVIANRNAPGSVELAEYYLSKREIQAQNLLVLRLSTEETCTRKEYDEKVARPVRAFLEQNRATAPVRCLVTVFGVPLRVGPPPMNDAEKKQMAALKDKEKRLKGAREELGETEAAKIKALDQELKALLAEMANLAMADQGAALDSDLSLVLAGDYPLKGCVPNPFFVGFKGSPFPLSREKILFVSRLDGPSKEIVKRVIDDSLAAEQTGLSGTAYFDARWPRPVGDQSKGLQGYALYDHFIHQAAGRVRESGKLPVVLDDKSALFQPGQCPDAAVYCGWYSLAIYVDAFAWKPGSVGYHIASAEATTLKKNRSTVWCKRMLEEGVAATLGPVAEPYVQAFPLPELFFGLLLEGPLSLVESYFLSLPYISWQMALLGDPLYRPFKNTVPLHSQTG